MVVYRFMVGAKYGRSTYVRHQFAIDLSEKCKCLTLLRQRVYEKSISYTYQRFTSLDLLLIGR